MSSLRFTGSFSEEDDLLGLGVELPPIFPMSPSGIIPSFISCLISMKSFMPRIRLRTFEPCGDAKCFIKHFASPHGSKVLKRIRGMKDFIEIKHEMNEGIIPEGDIGKMGGSSTPRPKRSSSSEKLPVKRKLDISPPLADQGEKHKRPRR